MERIKKTSGYDKSRHPHGRRNLFIAGAAAIALAATLTVAGTRDEQPQESMRCEPYQGAYSLGNLSPGTSSGKIAEKLNVNPGRIAAGRLIYVACPEPVSKKAIDAASERVTIPGYDDDCLPVAMGSPEFISALRNGTKVPEAPLESADIIVACPKNEVKNTV